MKKILIMAGGTGGHVFPGLAVADVLKSRNEPWEVRWLGTKERMESTLVPKHGYQISFIKISGIRRNGLVRKLCAPFMIVRAIWEALGILREYKPDVVLGMGGYASGPGGIAAKILGIPLVLHEQNAAPGLTNRILAKFASKILLGFPKAINSEKAQFTGNPVRESVVALHKELPKDFSDPCLKLLIVGGSLGAQVLNETIPETIKKVLDKGIQIQVLHQTGKGNSEAVLESYRKLNVSEQNADVREFIDDMASAYKKSHVIICRAGALTSAEVGAAGIPAIFIPLPSAVDDHQTKNARALSDVGAAITLPQKEMTADKLADYLADFAVNRDKLKEMSAKTAELARLDAAEKIADVCSSLALKE